MSRTAIGVLFAAGLVAVTVIVTMNCGGGSPPPSVAPAVTLAPSPAPSPATAPATAATCGSGAKMRVHFYDVGQALSALVDLPDGRHVLVDAADTPKRSGCGDVCAQAESHLLGRLGADLHGDAIDLLWITHQHSDHLGGAPFVLAQFTVKNYVDNGHDTEKAEVRAARGAAERTGARIAIVDPEHRDVPLASAGGVRLTAMVPSSWPPKCKSDPNDCTIMLRIDYCSSSVLFTGDAEVEEEKLVESGGAVTLLQVGHHGSNTSSGEMFVARLAPKQAVISAGKPHEGLNTGYCHPRVSTVKRLTEHLGGPGSRTLRAYEAARCDDHDEAAWIDVPASDRLWATERDGDVVLVTTGDGAFVRE